MKVFKFIVKNWFILLISYFLFVFVDSSIEDFKVEKLRAIKQSVH